MFIEKVLKAIKNPNEFEERRIIDMVNRYHPEEISKFIVRNKNNEDYLKKIK